MILPHGKADAKWRENAMRAAATIATLIFTTAAVSADAPLVAYPDGYRSWRHVKSMLIEPGHPLHESFGGLHHLYANDAAMRGYREGRFEDGSVIVFDLLEAVRADNAVTTGQRKVLGVMEKNARRYASTGGWGFEGFKGDSRTERAVGANAAKACFGCHLSQKQRDYVFSRYAD
jgi:Cytochrome P460